MLAQFVRRAAVWSILVASAVRADVGFERAEWDPELSSFFVNVTGNNEDFDKVREAVRQASSWKVYFRGDGVGFESLTVKNQTRTVFSKIDALGSFMIPHPKELIDGELTIIFHPEPGSTVDPISPITISNKKDDEQRSGLRPLEFTSEQKDADIDISGGIQAGVDAKPLYFWKAKASYPFDISSGR